MADPKQIADALTQDQLLAQFNRDEASAEPWWRKGLSMEGRATFLPYKDTLPDSVMNKREVALPGLLAGIVNQFTAGNRAYTGSDPTFNPQEEAANFAMNTFGGGITTGAALRNPTGLGGKDLALNVYHGTPHEIKGGFDISKVGTGEGAQAFGHGMYFAENPAVAKEYQKMLAGPDQTAAEYLKMYKTPENAISVLENSITPNLTPEAKKYAQDAIDVLKSGKELIGNFYKADIPDEQIPKMLDWDKTFNQQAPEVKNIFLQKAKETPTWIEYTNTLSPDARKLADEMLSGAKPITGKESTKYWKQLDQLNPNANHNAIVDALADVGVRDPNKVIGRDLYNGIASTFDASQPEAYRLASKYLSKSGIPGIRYLDRTSRNIGNGTSNFVSFQPETVKILEKNNMPVTRKELLQQEFDKLDK